MGAILKSGKVSKFDVDAFKTAAATKVTFGFGQPLLSTTRKNGNYEYYAIQFDLYGEILYMYADWSINYKERLINWIVDWVAANGSII